MHTQLIITSAPSAYSYHPHVELDVSNLPEGSLFSKDWPSSEQLDDLANWKPNFDQFIWGYSNILVDASRIKKWTVIKVQSAWPDELDRHVKYQVARIESCLGYVTHVDAVHWDDDNGLPSDNYDD